MKKLAQGSVRVLGDDVNTDYIVPSHRKKETIDPTVLREFIFEDISRGFYENMDAETIIVAGKNFGCGSAMEIAVTVLQAAGVQAVIATSFSRTFRRNALNNGLLLCQVDDILVENGHSTAIFLENEKLFVELETRERIEANVLPHFMSEMLSCGGLTNYLKEKGHFL